MNYPQYGHIISNGDVLLFFTPVTAAVAFPGICDPPLRLLFSVRLSLLLLLLWLGCVVLVVVLAVLTDLFAYVLDVIYLAEWD